MKDEAEIPLELRNLSQKELCALEGISLSTLNKMERMGIGPQWTIFPGTIAKRITPSARL
jgi:transcriptional regulator with XRE-family HTH domain